MVDQPEWQSRTSRDAASRPTLPGEPRTDEDGRVAEAEQMAAEIISDAQPQRDIGLRFDRRSPFVIGLGAAAGVAVTYAGVRVLIAAAPSLVLIGLAFFLAVGLEPAAVGLVRRGLPRWAATTTVFAVAAVLIGAFIAAAVPPLSAQTRQLIDQAPHYIEQAQNHSSTIGRLNDRFHLQQRITDAVDKSGGSLFGALVAAGTAVFGVVADTLIVVVLTIYFLVDLPRIRTTLYRLVAHTRRPRAVIIGDKVFAKVGAYVLGNVATSVIAGAATAMWLIVFGVPYPVLLGLFVGLLDLVPIVGSTVAGVVVSAVALSVSLPVCIATAVFFIAYRLVEDYVLVPKIIGRFVKVSGVVTIVAVLIGAQLLGILGALIAIPIAAAAQLLIEELLFPRIDVA